MLFSVILCPKSDRFTFQGFCTSQIQFISSKPGRTPGIMHVRSAAFPSRTYLPKSRFHPDRRPDQRISRHTNPQGANCTACTSPCRLSTSSLGDELTTTLFPLPSKGAIGFLPGDRVFSKSLSVSRFAIRFCHPNLFLPVQSGLLKYSIGPLVSHRVGPSHSGFASGNRAL
jgi:hypothetical protein